MGIYVRLDVNPNGITASQWEAVYEESLLLLERFPVPLMRLAAREAVGGTRLVWTGDIVDRRGTPDECWSVTGDLETNRRAETFRLYRQVDRQFRYCRAFVDKDVLWRAGDGGNNGAEVLGNKTQGFPYHLAILAVAILVESRFPEGAAASGDIHSRDAAELVPWINSLVKVPVRLPVCFDFDRLYARLARLYTDAEAIQERLEELYRGSAASFREGVLRGAHAEAVLESRKKDLAGYTSLRQIGAIAILGEILQLTGDPGRLIEIVEEVNAARAGKKPFGLEELLRVTHARFTRAAGAAEGSERSGRMKTQEDMWGDLLRKLTGDDDPGYHIESAELLAAFVRRAPSRQAEFERIVGKSRRARLREPDRETGDAAPGEEWHGEAYIRRQVELQRETAVPEQTLVRMGEELGEAAGKLKRFVSADPRFYAGFLTWASGEAPLPLREETWKRIDEERDVEILKRLCTLAAIDNPELTFSECRQWILETPGCWPLLVGRRGGGSDGGI